MARGSHHYTIRTLYGLAKSKEVGLTDELLHLLVEKETGKTSIKDLSRSELAQVCRILQKQKDDEKRRLGLLKKNGNPVTERQRRKICQLEEKLGWSNDRNRLRGMIRRMFKVDALEWLNETQCQSLIEAINAIQERNRKGNKNAERSE